MKFSKHKVDPSKVAIIEGAVWNKLLEKIDDLGRLADLKSETLKIDRGTSAWKIEVIGVKGYSAQAVGFCDSNNNQTSGKMLIGPIGPIG